MEADVYGNGTFRSMQGRVDMTSHVKERDKKKTFVICFVYHHITLQHDEKTIIRDNMQIFTN